MQRVFHSKEDRKFANRWLLIVVAVYSTAAIMVVTLAPSPATTSHHASLAPMAATASAQIQRQADRMSRYRLAQPLNATQDADARTAEQ